MRLQVFFHGLWFAFIQLVAGFRRLVEHVRVSWRTKMILSSNQETIGIYFCESGKAGETRTIQVQPPLLFRGNRLVARDTSSRPGRKTMIMGMFVGNKPQMITFASGTLTCMFAEDVVGNNFVFDTCDPNLLITFQVRFLADCDWVAELWGDAICVDDVQSEVTRRAA